MTDGPRCSCILGNAEPQTRIVTCPLHGYDPRRLPVPEPVAASISHGESRDG